MKQSVPRYNDLNGYSLPKCRILPALFKQQSKRAVRQETKRIGRAGRQGNISDRQTTKTIKKIYTKIVRVRCEYTARKA